MKTRFASTGLSLRPIRARARSARRRLAPFALAAALTATVAGAMAGCSGNHKAEADQTDQDARTAPTAPVVKVARQNLANELEIASEFLPYQEIDVYAKVSGYIQKLYVDWGTHVKQGQMLAVLEIPELQQQLQQDEASVHRSEQRPGARQRRAQPRAIRIQRRAPDLHAPGRRAENAARAGGAAGNRRRARQGSWKPTPGVSAAKDALAAAEQALLAAKAALEKDKALYAYARITAPFDGVVTEIHAYTGALLPGGNVLQQRRLGAVPSLAKRSAAPGDSRAGKRGAGYSHRPERSP